MEIKVLAGAAGATVTASVLGLVIAWAVTTFTSVQMPEAVATGVGVILLSVIGGIGALVSGWAKKSETSATSEGATMRSLRVALEERDEL
jgi:hypothetical protein